MALRSEMALFLFVLSVWPVITLEVMDSKHLSGATSCVVLSLCVSKDLFHFLKLGDGCILV